MYIESFIWGPPVKRTDLCPIITSLILIMSCFYGAYGDSDSFPSTILMTKVGNRHVVSGDSINKPSSGLTIMSFIIDNVSVIRDTTAYFGDILIEQDGVLILDNATLYCSSISVEEGGNLTVRNSRVFLETNIDAQNGSYLLVSDSMIYDGGIEIYTPNAEIYDSLINNTDSYGVAITRTKNVRLVNVTIISSGLCIDLADSNNTVISGCVLEGGGIFVSNSYNNTVSQNTINGRSLVYLEDASNVSIDDAGQIILVDCSNITIHGLVLENIYVGIELWMTSNSIIYECELSCWEYGIYAVNSSIIELKDLTFTNTKYGLYIENTANITMDSCVIDNCTYSAYLYETKNASITNNTIRDNVYGLYIMWSYFLEIKDNNFLNCGVFLYESSYNTVVNNTVNGKALVYVEGDANRTISDAGQVIVVDSTNITIENVAIGSASVGIEVGHSTEVRIKNCRVSNNVYGLFVYCCGSVNITSNIIFNNSYGIELQSCFGNVNITNNNITDNNVGIYLSSATVVISMNYIARNSDGITIGAFMWGNIITENEIFYCSNGILLEHSSNNNMIINNKIAHCYRGVTLELIRIVIVISPEQPKSDGVGIPLYRDPYENVIGGNSISYCDYGIMLAGSNNSAENNSIEFCLYGIYLSGENQTIKDNVFIGCGLFVDVSVNKHSIVMNNTVNGKPLVYLENISEETISEAGQIIMVNCTDITITGVEIMDTTVGIELIKTEQCVIEHSGISGGIYGVYAYQSEHIYIRNSIITGDSAIYLESTTNYKILENEITGTHYGIYVSLDSDNGTIEKNTIAYGEDSRDVFCISGDAWFVDKTLVMPLPPYASVSICGIYVCGSDNLTITENNLAYGMASKAFLKYRQQIIEPVLTTGVYKLYLETCGIFISYSDSLVITNNTLDHGGLFMFWTHENFVLANTINGKPIVYLEDMHNVTIREAGQVILINCTGVMVMGCEMSYVSVGVEVLESRYVSIIANVFSRDEIGVFSYMSYNSSVYLNDFINNTGNIYLDTSEIRFWTEKEVYYIYDGAAHYGYMGNYWSDYNGTDQNGDGIGDEPYVNIDEYPLVKPIGHYNVSILYPMILDYSPKEETLRSIEGEEVTFGVNISQRANISWFNNGEIVHEDANVKYSTITLVGNVGTWNITVIIRNQNGSTMLSWIWTVEPKKHIISTSIIALGVICCFIIIIGVVLLRRRKSK